MTVRKHKILSDAEIDGNLKANSVTVPDIQNGVLVTDAQGNIIADQTISIDDLHSIPIITTDVQQLKDDLTQEIQDREDADTALQGNIDAEVARATAMETMIQSNLTNEMTTREAGDQYLASQILAEETRATTAEQALQSQIDNLDSDKQDKMTASNGVKIVGVDIQHTNSVTAGDTGSSADSIPKITFDAQGHITAKDTVQIQIAESQVTDLETHLDEKAPNNHADATDKYGVGDETKYGHVKVDTSVSASSNNPVRNSAVKSYVDETVATASANYLGNYDAVTDLGNSQALVDTWTLIPTDATKSLVASQITSALPQGTIPSKNDYVFISVNKSTTLNEDWFWRFKYSGTVWIYEFYLRNPTFTENQWKAINSLISNSGNTGIDVQTIINHIADGTIHVTQADKDNWNNKVDKLTTSPAGTYPKVTVNAQGQVVSGESLVESDIPQLSISKITNLQTELDSKVEGPSSAVSDNVALFDGATGKIIKDSGKTLGASIPAPTVADKDKALIVNATGNGFIFGEAGSVDDVQINNGVSIVTNKVAQIPFRTTKIQLTEVD